MLALVATPAIKSAFHIRFRPPGAEANQIARLIATLHDSVVNPVAAPGTAAAAKRMLIGVLERTREMHLPSMIVPPITHVSSDRARKRNPEEQADALEVREAATVRIVPVPRNRSGFARRDRANSSRTFHAGKSIAHAERAFSHAAGGNMKHLAVHADRITRMKETIATPRHSPRHFRAHPTPPVSSPFMSLSAPSLTTEIPATLSVGGHESLPWGWLDRWENEGGTWRRHQHSLATNS